MPIWRARDTTLDRDVAIKAIPPAFAADAERLLRFEREAKVLASINHPHIAAIHGLHDDHGQRFLAMELVPGEDLAARIGRGPLPLDEALACAGKIALALEYAHERGIVHRDLKPANIKITPDGDVKVLDFGLAKAIAGDGAALDPATTPTMIPTVTSAGTAIGVILGTAASMSPEQARGRAVDKRADNWAFGCVLYEMLTGQRLFDGETVTAVLAAVVTRDPDWTRLPAAYPFDVARGALSDESTLVASPVYPGGNQHHLPASASAGGMLAYQNGTAEMELVLLDQAGRVSRTVGAPDRYGNAVVSQDGKRVAFEVFTDSGERLVWAHDLERGVRTPVSQRGKMADSAAWAPDGETVYFDANATGKWEVFRKVISGGGEPEDFGSPGPTDVAVLDVSPDGRWLLVNSVSAENRLDLYLKPLAEAWTGGPP